MQSSPQIPSVSPALRFPRKFLLPNAFPLLKSCAIPAQGKTFVFKASSLSNSLKTSHTSDFQQFFDNEGQSLSKKRLPVVIKKDGRVSRFFWNGNCLELITLDGGAAKFSFNFEDGLRQLLRICGSGVRGFFIPKQAHGNYIDYVKWKFLHRVFSSALQVLATQAMFRAIGVGYARSLPSAAALNWVLKDGLGRLSRCIYTASVGSAFDTNLKRVRFATSILFSLSIGIELMTQVFPHCFLLLASVANVAKQISLACYLATSSAVHRSFAIADNLGEVSAKAQIQTVCFDNLGLLLAALLNLICKHSQRLQAGLPFFVYPIFSAIDLYGIYQSLKHVHLQTLTKERLEIILNTWIQFGYVPSPAEVSAKEGINLLENAGKEPLPIRIGCLDAKSQIPMLTLLAIESLSSDDFYFICIETCRRMTKTGPRILLCLREGAGAVDIIKGLLQACYIQKSLHLTISRWEDVLKACDISDSLGMEWLKMIGDSKHRAQGDLTLLREQMLGLRWAVNNILLSTREQVRYNFVGEDA
ncbi:hypothetical protein Nepgr_008276 [Nepenthes gracilis]|uniref:Protein root UVB sensitive/RUS domain-containing protein n=1 Tax=Nepenthes gracilis TaxID=150966 RepID=A0AAD3XJA5_NEPGR|nr:hypothetical protein Nepgr_008276 [Nepenthes gracilis]